MIDPEMLDLDEQIDDLAAENPLWALRRVPQWLSSFRLDACAMAEPAAALMHAEHLLTPERRAWCLSQAPELRRYVPDRLEPERRKALGLHDAKAAGDDAGTD
jgi:hypothetical protein